jgi:hypothetical protein
MPKIIIEINNCKHDKCPHFTITKTESTDGFDLGEYWHCKKADRQIAAFVEWHEERKELVPDWCPLLFPAK